MPAISPVKIANMALSHIGSSATIENFDEESIEAKQLKLWYDWARIQTLMALNWNFARKRMSLAPHSDAPPSEWAFRYQYPADAVAIRYIVNPAGKQADAIPFEIELDSGGNTKSVVTNMAEAEVVYTYDLSTTSLFSPMFINALSFILGSMVAFALTGKLSIVDRCNQQAARMLRAAQAFDANEHVGEPPRDTEWIRERA